MTASSAPAAATAAPVLLVEEVGDGVLLIELNRPERRNALNAELRSSLRRAIDAFDADDRYRCAVLAARGPTFCAGGDLREMAEVELTVPGDDWTKLLGTRGRSRKPIVAAVQGHAFGGGFLLALGCDLCVCDATAQFAISEVRRGRGAPWAAPLFSMVPKRIMSQLLLTGEPLTADRAHEVGLSNYLVPAGEATATAIEVARSIARNAPLSVAAARDLVELCTEVGESAADRAAYWLYEHVYRSQDAIEGPAAFMEKREPVWRGA